MRKNMTRIVCILCVLCLCVGITACKNNGNNSQNPPKDDSKALLNGGFESADLSGWTIEYGDAFDDD